MTRMTRIRTTTILSIRQLLLSLLLLLLLLSSAPTTTTTNAQSISPNLALHKPTRQSSISHNGYSSRAVDGNRDGIYAHGSISHTGGVDGWWEVDLQMLASITQILIFNRLDCCSSRLDYAVVSILAYNREEVMTTMITQQSPEYVVLDLSDSPIEGTYVTVSHPNGVVALAEVEVYGDYVGEVPPIGPSLTPSSNIALHKPATQSSTAHDATASLAVDGNTQGDFALGSVTHTGKQYDNWWMVDLEMVANIEMIILYNRLDSNQGNLDHAVITILDHRMTEVSQVTLDESNFELVILNLDNVEGSYVKVTVIDNTLSLAEVEVYGTELYAKPNNVPPALNLALHRPATQASTVHNGDAGRAVDGTTFGWFYGGSVTHTGPLTPWWMVDLQVVAAIDKIILFNRVDCCQENLNHARVIIYDYAMVEVASVNLVEDSPEMVILDFNGSVEGTYVRITSPDRTTQSLAEVKVYGIVVDPDVPAPAPPPSYHGFTGPNLALHQSVHQSSVAHHGDAYRAVDGNTDGHYANGSVTHTGIGYPWWQVSLNGLAFIDAIVLYNRLDCCMENMDSLVVSVLDFEHNVVISHPVVDQNSPEVVVLDFAHSVGTYVRVEQSLNIPMFLAEVEVYGSIYTNLALHKPATQSGTAHGGTADKAVDGNKAQVFGSGSVTHTNGHGDDSAWWQVDLETTVSIVRVVIYNRIDGNVQNLNHAVVTLLDDTDDDDEEEQIVVKSITLNEDSPKVVEVDMGSAQGRYLKISLSDNAILNLAEVEVYGSVVVVQS